MIDFFIIGTQKGGTESAIYHLNQHPQIYLPNKEIQYFNQPLLYEKHMNDLKKNFEVVVNNCKKEEKLEKIENKELDHLLIGVKNPEYMYIPKSITLLNNIYPESKLIIFLREPVSRAYSEYNIYL